MKPIVFPKWVTQASAVFFGLAGVLQLLQGVLAGNVLPPWVPSWVLPAVFVASAVCGFLGKSLGDANHDGTPDLFELAWWQTTGKSLLAALIAVVRSRGTPPSAPPTLAADHTDSPKEPDHDQ